MKTIHSLLFIPLLFLATFSFSQKALVQPAPNTENSQLKAGMVSTVMEASLAGEVQQNTNNTKWAVSLRPISGKKHHSPEVEEIKRQKWIEKNKNTFSSIAEGGGKADLPVIGTNFEANWSIAVNPPDNSIAVSNAGYIVSANNDGVATYTTSGTYLNFDYWSDFFNDVSLNALIYDPKVIYDSQADRFFMVVLHGTSSSTTKVIVCFSKSNNPQDGWWYYKLTGNVLNDNSWFDYPNIGVSNNEVYVTGNLYYNNNNNNQSIIYQIEKSAGYAGTNLNWQYWYNLSSSPYGAFTLVPTTNGHQGTVGPGMYFVSNRSSGESRIRLWHLTDDLSGSPQLNAYSVNTSSYSVGGNAAQLGSSESLDNGDCRIKDAFYLNGTIHFVFHSDIGSGWNGVNYNRLHVSSLTNQSSTFGYQGSYDYCYPSLASFTTNATSQSVMIAFLRSSSAIYPEVRAVHCDNSMSWSSSKQIKAGETYVSFLSGNERWGDYSGVARKHNDPYGNVWAAGCYGAGVSGTGYNHTYKTWIAEIEGNNSSGIEDPEEKLPVSLFPNPAYDLISILFTIEKREEIQIELVDINGKLIKLLYRDMPKIGDNRLVFNKGAIKAGTYFVVFKTKNKILKNEKIIILD